MANAAKNLQTVAKVAYASLATMTDTLKSSELKKQLSAKQAWRQVIAADILRRRDDDSGMQAALNVARSSDPARRDAVEVLGRFRHAKTVPTLIDALEDLGKYDEEPMPF